ncbi:MAG: serine/threonine protein kinase, partial [Gemmatimonadales bacterium]|nr:serine/threonine protein kinase [Gemmatimonadales bacterium]
HAARRVARFCTAQVLDVGIDGDRPFIVSEYIVGRSLHEQVARAGPRSDADLERLAIGTVTALAAIHSVGIVHRDFKPGNVLLAADGPRVIDFGIARALDASASVTSQTIGTPAYMAPEQLAGSPVGPAADMFSWATTMVFAATGKPAFGIDTLPAIINRVLNSEPDLGEPHLVPQPLRSIILAALAKNPADRPTARQALQVLVEGSLDAETGWRGKVERVLPTGSEVVAPMARTLIEQRPTSGDSNQADRIRFRDIPPSGKFLLFLLFILMVMVITILAAVATAWAFGS